MPTARASRVRSTPDGTRRPCCTLRRRALSRSERRRRSGDRVRRAQSPAWPAPSDIGGHAGALESSFVAGPGLRQEQSQAHHHRDLAARQRPRHQGLATGRLAQGRRVLRPEPDRMRPLLRQHRVVDDEEGVGGPAQRCRWSPPLIVWSRRNAPPGGPMLPKHAADPALRQSQLVSRTWSMQARRRAGLRSSPVQPRRGSSCLKSDQRLRAEDGCSPPPDPSSV